jgi:hypothetical protein
MTISDDEIAELQKRRQAILSDQFPDDSNEPVCEAEDVGCSCTEAGIGSEWDWNESQQVYVCNGCGEVQ